MEGRRLALFGGSFDPPHVGHLMVGLYVLATRPVDELLVVPCPVHPLGKSLTPWSDRAAMCRLAFADLARVTVSDLEQRLGPPTRTIRTVEHLLAQEPRPSISLIVGADILDEAHQWYQWERLVTLVDLVVVGRGQAGGRVRVPDVSSSQVRSAVASGLDITDLVPLSVVEYIRSHGLYGASAHRAGEK